MTLLLRAAAALAAGDVRFALIGAAAMAAHGVSRSTPYRYLLEYCPFLGPVRETPRFEAVLATARELVETFVPKEAALED